jgi:hypothetical protein
MLSKDHGKKYAEKWARVLSIILALQAIVKPFLMKMTLIRKPLNL